MFKPMGPSVTVEGFGPFQVLNHTILPIVIPGIRACGLRNVRDGLLGAKAALSQPCRGTDQVEACSVVSDGETSLRADTLVQF